ncbi:MAG: rhodanese-like domain-containing protein [Candidatus Rokubacteria bacterium]|nr:rhodanese-like domain-containing protein [Candidatus Rokubacteria bacterium]
MITTRAMGHLFAVLLVVLASAVAVPAGQAGATRTVAVENGRSYTDVNAAALQAMLARKDFVLVNVHIPYEGEIERTDRFIPFNAIEANLDRLPARKDARVVLYCRSDRMSSIAARTLVKLGYTNVWNLQGGMVAWQDAGFAVAHRRR